MQGGGTHSTDIDLSIDSIVNQIQKINQNCLSLKETVGNETETYSKDKTNQKEIFEKLKSEIRNHDKQLDLLLKLKNELETLTTDCEVTLMLKKKRGRKKGFKLNKKNDNYFNHKGNTNINLFGLTYHNRKNGNFNNNKDINDDSDKECSLDDNSIISEEENKKTQVFDKVNFLVRRMNEKTMEENKNKVLIVNNNNEENSNTLINEENDLDNFSLKDLEQMEKKITKN